MFYSFTGDKGKTSPITSVQFHDVYSKLTKLFNQDHEYNIYILPIISLVSIYSSFVFTFLLHSRQPLICFLFL